MEEDQCISTSAAPSSSNNNDILSATSSPLPASQLAEAEVHNQHDDQQQANNSYHGISLRFSGHVLNFGSSDTREDIWSCMIVLVTLWFFASVTLIVGYYGSFNAQLGPNSSYLIKASPFFVRYIKAEQLDDQTEGLMLYGFHETPSLNDSITWSRGHNASIEPYLYKDWTYYLNAGSQINVSYHVKVPTSSPLSIVIAQGRDSLARWIDDPLYPNSTLYWRNINGSGEVLQNIQISDTYYVAVGNMQSQTALVDVNISIQSVLYNTSSAFFKCSLANQICSFKLFVLRPNAAVLTSPGTEAKDDHGWYIKVSYGPQWLTYLGGSCLTIILLLVMLKSCDMFESNNGHQATATGTERQPLLSSKDDLSGWGSSYDSIPNDEEEDHEEKLEEGKAQNLSETNTTDHSPRQCVICFDAPQDSFFLPCGHCAACFTCGSRIAEEAGSCPICRRKMKKVRRIFAV